MMSFDFTDLSTIFSLQLADIHIILCQCEQLVKLIKVLVTQGVTCYNSVSHIYNMTEVKYTAIDTG